MGFLSKWFKKKDKDSRLSLADYLNGYSPLYSQFGHDIYASDVVQQAIFSIVNELKKLDPVHVRKSKGLEVSVEGNIQNILDNPNPLMTTSDFLEKISWNLLLNSNSFIYPMWENGNLVALYPLQPLGVDFLQDESGTLFIKFRFNDSKNDTVLPYDSVIHIRYKYSVSEFMGGNVNGQPDNKALLETLQLNDSLLKGLAKALNMQMSIKGLLKIKTMANKDDQIARIKEFEDKLKNSDMAIGITDIANEYVPINNPVQLLDATTLQFIDKKILRWYGISVAIIDGDYTPQQYEAFYQKTLEPIIKAMSEAFTKGLFSRRGSSGYGNKIRFYSKELIFMSTDQKIRYFTLLSNQGGCYVNEIRVAFGLRPDSELDGVRCQSLNFVNADKADEYQGVGGEENGE